MKIKLSKFKINAGVIVKKHTNNLTEMAEFESVVVNSISKFNAGRNVSIVSGHEVTLDPSGKTPPQVGPDPSRVEKLVQMEPPKN